MSNQMTAAAWRRGTKNALLCGIAVSAVVVGLTYLIAALLQLDWRQSTAIASATVWAFALAAFVTVWFWGRRTAGPVLLDCGPHPAQRLFLLNAAIFTGLAIAALALGLSGRQSVVVVAFGGLFAASFAIYWLMLARGRLQIREDGIWQYWSLLRWDRVRSYAWKAGTQPTLMLQTTAAVPALGRGALPVPLSHQPTIDRLLREHGVAH